MSIDQKPFVSVVIPTSNRPLLLLRAVRSALEQTLQPIEVIVVIDGADSATRDALEQLGDRRLVVLATEARVGGSEARNIGARSARSQWVALLDDDDEWLPGKVQAQLSGATSGQGYDLVVNSHIHRAAGQPDVVRPRRLPRPGEPPSEFMFDYLCYFQTSTFFCRRSLLLTIPFKKDQPFFQDVDWFLRATREPSTRLLVLPVPLTIYYAPEQRDTITSKLPWTSRLAWGRENRHLMTSSAYSRFVVGSCAARAVEERAGWPGFLRLLSECVLRGRPTPKLLAILCAIFLLTPGRRKELRNRFLLRRALAS